MGSGKRKSEKKKLCQLGNSSIYPNTLPPPPEKKNRFVAQPVVHTVLTVAHTHLLVHPLNQLNRYMFCSKDGGFTSGKLETQRESLYDCRQEYELKKVN